MTNVDIIRAWKDEEYRLSLSEAQLATLPANPAGQIELAEADLEEVSGGLGKNKNQPAPADDGASKSVSNPSKSVSNPSKPSASASASVSGSKVSGGTTSKTTSAGSR